LVTLNFTREEKKEKHPLIVNDWLVIPAILHPSNWKSLFGYLVYQIWLCLSVLGNALRVKKIILRVSKLSIFLIIQKYGNDFYDEKKDTV